MSLSLFWFLPLHGDGRYLGSENQARAVDHTYLEQIAQAADRLGYEGVLLPTGRSCEDPFIAAASLISATKNLKFLVAVRPSIQSPTASARIAATFDRLSAGRLLINVVAGGDAAELEGDGVWVTHDDRYVQAGEFLHIWRNLLEGKTVDFEGTHLKVKGARQVYPAVQKPYPPLYFGGSSPAAHEVAAEHVEVYLTWGEPVAEAKKKFDDIRQRAAKLGRTVKFGVRFHVIVRETEEEARQAADDLIRFLDPELVAKAQASLAKMDSHGQKNMLSLHQGDKDKLWVAPHVWAGVGLVRGGAGTAIVGNPEQVAAVIKEYSDIGAETFIFSGYPHLEEAYRFAELVFPLLPVKIKEKIGANLLSPFGEAIANSAAPRTPEPVGK